MADEQGRDERGAHRGESPEERGAHRAESREERGAHRAESREERGVEVRTDRATVRESRRDPGVMAARANFGGIDIPATLVGMLTALALLVLLGGLIAAALGAVGYQLGLDETVEEVSIAGFVGGLVTLFVAFLIGGWAAARIARYDGVRNGLMTAIWALVLAAILSVFYYYLGAEY